MIYPNKRNTYECEGCKEKFRLKTTLDQHKRVCKDYKILIIKKESFWDKW